MAAKNSGSMARAGGYNELAVQITGWQEAREKPKKENTVSSEDRVAHFHRPDQRRHAQKTHPPPQLSQDEQSSSPTVQHSAIAGENVSRACTRIPKLWRHGRRRSSLVGNDFEQPVPILPPDPGGDSASGNSVAVPEDDMSPLRIDDSHGGRILRSVQDGRPHESAGRGFPWDREPESSPNRIRLPLPPHRSEPIAMKSQPVELDIHPVN